jgi:hypothetical protein
MVLEKYLMPDEQIRYEHPTKCNIGEISYNIYITDVRLIGYNQKGLIFKKDNVITINLDDIKSLDYKEKGIINKKGILKLNTGNMSFSVYGNPIGMTQLWQSLQSFIKKK